MYIYSLKKVLLIRSPCKNLKPYDNPFWGFEQRYQEEEKKRKGLITLNSGLPKLLRWRTYFARTKIYDL